MTKIPSENSENLSKWPRICFQFKFLPSQFGTTTGKYKFELKKPKNQLIAMYLIANAIFHIPGPVVLVSAEDLVGTLVLV